MKTAVQLSSEMNHRIDSCGADIVISKKIINLVTSEYTDEYEWVDYFATPDEFSDYVDMLVEFRDGQGEVPECWKKAFNE